MAYVEWRGGRWKVQVREDGRHKWRDLPAEIRVDQPELAKAVGAGMADRIRRGDSVPEARGETVREWYGRWFAWRQTRGDADVTKMRGRFERYVAEEIGALPMHAVRREHLKRIVGLLDALVEDETIAWKTATNVWSQVVSRPFADAANGKKADLCVLVENPASDVAPPDKGAKVRKQYLYPEEAIRLLSCADVPLWRRRLYAFAVYTYMRAGEIAALQWEDVDLARGLILVHQSMDRDVNVGRLKATKTDEARPVVIEPALWPMIEAMRAERRRGPVFDRLPPAHGHDGQAATLRLDIETAEVEREALTQRSATRTRKRITFHDLRATGITWAAIRGDDPLKIMARSGHTEYQTMLGYVREAEVVREGFGEVFPPLPAVLGGPPQNRPKAPNNSRKTPEKLRPQGDSNALGNDVESPRKTPKRRESTGLVSPNGDGSLGAKDSLAEALRLAAEAGRWDLVGQLARQLAELQRATDASPLMRLVVAKRK